MPGVAYLQEPVPEFPEAAVLIGFIFVPSTYCVKILPPVPS